MAKSGAETAKERAAKGLCCSCAEKATKGGRCDKHWKIAKEKAAERYQLRKAGTKCTYCRINDKEKDKSMCRPCLDRQNGRRQVPESEKHKPYEKPWHQRNKDSGYCIKGGENHKKPSPGHVICDECRKKKRENTAKRKLKGLCKLCPNTSRPGKRTCESCYENIKAIRKQRIKDKICAECGKTRPTNNNKICDSCLERGRLIDKRKNRKLRDEVFKAYGGYVCACCGETRKTFLTLDHINNDGNEHRRRVTGENRSSTRVFIDLRRRGFPPGMQVLCMSCNLSKQRNGGICEHKRPSPDSEA